MPDDSPPPDAGSLVLIANDQEWTSRAIASILTANGYRVAHAFTAAEALAVAGRTEPELVILDHQLPDIPGTEVCRRLRADPRFGPALPIIITTAGPSGRPQRMSAYAAGAWEFYGQPLDSDALLHKAVVYTTAYREARKLRRGALIDDASGLYNESALVHRANEAIAKARRLGRTVAGVAWSLSDAAAAKRRNAAAAFRSGGRAADTLGCLDSGAFAAVATGIDRAGAKRMAARLREALADAAGVNVDEIRTTVVTGGDATELPSDGEELLKQLGVAIAA